MTKYQTELIKNLEGFIKANASTTESEIDHLNTLAELQEQLKFALAKVEDLNTKIKEKDNEIAVLTNKNKTLKRMFNAIFGEED